MDEKKVKVRVRARCGITERIKERERVTGRRDHSDGGSEVGSVGG